MIVQPVSDFTCIWMRPRVRLHPAATHLASILPIGTRWTESQYHSSNRRLSLKKAASVYLYSWWWFLDWWELMASIWLGKVRSIVYWSWPTDYWHQHKVRAYLSGNCLETDENCSYRLGIFGNLTSEELRSQGYLGNNSLRDQQIAFEWIKTNISGFGGDPQKNFGWWWKRGRRYATNLSFIWGYKLRTNEVT